MKYLYFAKVKPDAIIPSKREEDGAFDLYACFDEPFLLLRPHETTLIPTGLASAFSSDYVAVIKERGSTGTKGMGQRCGVVDSGYRGEWFVPITNHNDTPIIIRKKDVDLDAEFFLTGLTEAYGSVTLYPYEKAIAQVIMVEVPKLSVDELNYEDLMRIESERGTGALGSSGK